LLLSIITLGVSGSDRFLGVGGRDLDRGRVEDIEVYDERSVILLVGEGAGVCLGEIMTMWCQVL